MMRRGSPKSKLLAAVASLLVGLLFAITPGHDDPSFRRWIGFIWLITGALWSLTWWKARRRAAAG